MPYLKTVEVSPVFLLADGIPTTIDNLVDECALIIRRLVGEELDRDAGTKYPTWHDLPEKIEATYELVFVDVLITGDDGVTRKLNSCAISAITRIRAEIVKPVRKVFGDVGVLVGECDVPEMKERATITITQVPGESFVRTLETTTKLGSA